jgi:hypothetical protein
MKFVFWTVFSRSTNAVLHEIFMGLRPRLETAAVFPERNDSRRLEVQHHQFSGTEGAKRHG